jgi:hypothetical protein
MDMDDRQRGQLAGKIKGDNVGEIKERVVFG